MKESTPRNINIDPLKAAAALLAAYSFAEAVPPVSAAVKVDTPTEQSSASTHYLHEKEFQANGFEASPADNVKSVSVKNRVTYINNRPAFLFGVYAQNSDWAISALNANVFIDSGEDTTPSLLAQQVRGSAWVLRQSRPGMVLGEPFSNEIGVATEDEAPEHGTSIDEFSQTPQDGRLTYGNFSTNMAGIVYGNKEDEANYLPYIAALGPKAIVGTDFYPDALGTPNGLAHMYDYVVGERMMSGPNTPVEAWIQTVNFTVNPNTGAPITENLKPSYMLSEAKAAITAGATMINWWDRDNGGAPESTTPDMAAKIRDFSKKVHSLAPCFLGNPIEDYNSSTTDLIKVGGATFFDSSGYLQYCIKIFNSSDRSIAINKTLPNLSSQKVRDLWSNSLIKSHSGRISAILPSGDWLILTYPEKPSSTKSVKYASSLHERVAKSNR